MAQQQRPMEELSENTSYWQILVAFLGIPVLLVVLDLLVNPQNWSLSVTEPAIWSSPDTLLKSFTSSYVHGGLGHLLGNVSGYILLMAGLFPLAILAERKKQLLFFSLLFLIVGPLWTSYFSLVIPFSMNALGFSGVNAAFLGYLPIPLFAAARNRTEFDVHPVWSLGPFLITMAMIVWYLPTVYPPMNPVPNLVYGFGILGLALSLWPAFRIYQNPSIDSSNPDSWIIAWGALMMILGLWGLFFGITPSIETNTFAHFGGYFLGYGLAFAVETGSFFKEIFEQIGIVSKATEN